MKNKKNGFTLVELLAVIVILAIILTFAVANVSKLRKRETIKNKRNAISSILTAAKNYCAEKTCGSSDTVSVSDLINAQYLTLDSDMENEYKDLSVSVNNSCGSSLKRYFLFNITDKSFESGINNYDDCGCDVSQDGNKGQDLCTNGDGTYSGE